MQIKEEDVSKPRRERDLAKEIARLTCKYEENESVDCIYLLPYDLEGTNNYELVVVFSERDDIIEKEIIEYNRKNEEDSMIEQYGGVLRIFSDRPFAYSTDAVERWQLAKVKDLMSSQILFDREGFYTKVATQFDKKVDRSINKFMPKYLNCLDYKIDRKLLLEYQR